MYFTKPIKKVHEKFGGGGKCLSLQCKEFKPLRISKT